MNMTEKTRIAAGLSDTVSGRLLGFLNGTGKISQS